MKLVLVHGNSPGKIFPLEDGSNLIGRWDPESGAFPEVDLEEEDAEAKISRKHAVIEIAGSKACVRDADSRNGTYLNGSHKLEPGVVHELKHGDEIIVGKVVLRFEVPKGKVSSIMGVMTLLQSKFSSVQVEIVATDGEISERDYEDKIMEAFRQLGIEV